VFGLNNRGQVAGYTAADPMLNDAHGFLLARVPNGQVTRIDVPDAARTLALGINDRGKIVGAYERTTTAPGMQRALESQPELGSLLLGFADKS